MEEQLTKAELLDRLQTTRAEWDALLDAIPQARYEEPGVAGEWSLKDIIAHISWHEREMIGLVQTHALAGSDLWDLPFDERNNILFEQNRNRALADVLTESRLAYQHLLQTIEETLDEQELHDPTRFANMPPDWIPWRLIAENSYIHYQDHTPDIRAWLGQP
jgi:hypothetical protein